MSFLGYHRWEIAQVSFTLISEEYGEKDPTFTKSLCQLVERMSR